MAFIRPRNYESYLGSFVTFIDIYEIIQSDLPHTLRKISICEFLGFRSGAIEVFVFWKVLPRHGAIGAHSPSNVAQHSRRETPTFDSLIIRVITYFRNRQKQQTDHFIAQEMIVVIR